MKTSARVLLYVVAALCVAYAAFGAENFNGTTDKAVSTTPESTVLPFTICARGRSSNTTGNQVAAGFSRVAFNDYYLLIWGGAISGDPASAALTDGVTGVTADSTSGYSANVWASACAVFTSATSRAGYIDGGNKGTNTTSVTPAASDRFEVGVLERTSPLAFFAGDIAEVGLWSVALTDDDVAMLAKYAPPCVRRDALYAYYPMVNDSTTLKDIFSDVPNNLTLTGGTNAPHPQVINCQ